MPGLVMVVLAAFAVAAPAASTPGRIGTCHVEGPRTGIVARLGPRLDLHLTDGNVLVPRGLMALDAGIADAPASGAVVRYEPLGDPDRWGRIEARIETADMIAPHREPHWRWWDEMLLQAGLAVVRSERQADPCRMRLRAAEASARAQRRGIWAQPAWPAQAEMPDSVLNRVGRFGIVEGRVASVGERRSMVYLNFGSDWANDMTVSIGRAVWTRLAASGIRSRDLKGARVLVRGLIREAGGPLIELAHPDDIEILER